MVGGDNGGWIGIQMKQCGSSSVLPKGTWFVDYHVISTHGQLHNSGKQIACDSEIQDQYCKAPGNY